MNKLRKNIENNSIYNSLKKKKLRINLTKDVNNLYTENNKPLKKSSKKTTGRNISHPHGLAESTQ
jgi:hypothetical protein